jgi:hypothetical protein
MIELGVLGAIAVSLIAIFKEIRYANNIKNKQKKGMARSFARS